ncbi:hypothetical protein KPH14_005090 [Odynerus spinipes]|uniref:Uncharacterized protein n=1 Tax=Odynerus spinipes TaxID=1348599 RepID=A0AAD9RKS3_9HYME|nr:hypothetical protein KPH14_005090 [Odynerus spinipes]
MSRSKKSRTSHKLQGNRDNFQKPVEQDDEEDNSFFSTEDRNNEINRNSSPTNQYDTKTLDIPGHSTPFQTKTSMNDMEGSPEPDYRCSPILIPCTQEVNEVAWDWHSSINKPSDKEKAEANQANTPKRTILLQKKRNSNSPLLNQPFRRKLAKAEYIESIGKFAAELKALTEKMKSIQRNDEDHFLNKEDDKKIKMEDEVEEDEANVQMALDANTSNSASASINKMSTSLEELFDESIEDSMVKCSQEIEEKFNLCSSRGSSTANSSNGSREKFIHTDSSSENSKNSLLSPNSPVLNVSSFCKTYSKNTSSRSTDARVNILEKKEEPMQKPSLNNNMINVHNGSLQNQKNPVRKNSSDLFEIPDDSFDDCLATCMEDEKLLPRLAEYDNIFPDMNSKSHQNEKNYKHSNVGNKYTSKTSNTLKSNSTSHNNSGSINQISMDGSRSVEKFGTNLNVMESRKFFKTKSLSDSYFGQERNTNVISKVGTSNSRQITKYFSHSNLPSKLQVNTSGKNTVNGAVYTEKNIKSVNGKESVYALSTSKIISKDSGCSMSKTNSTTGDSQIMQCTPEEIEKKRLEAKMRLEAKRKMQINTNKTNFSEIPVKRVQR